MSAGDQNTLEFYGKPEKIIGQGAYGQVSLYSQNNKKYAMKKMKFEASSIREIAIMKRMDQGHPKNGS